MSGTKIIRLTLTPNKRKSSKKDTGELSGRGTGGEHQKGAPKEAPERGIRGGHRRGSPEGVTGGSHWRGALIILVQKYYGSVLVGFLIS